MAHRRGAGAPARELLLLDEPTSQLDPVAGDELVWLLRRLNEDWGTAVVMAEHRLERCLPAADRVIALEGGRDRLRRRRPGEFLDLGRSSRRPALATPAARLFSQAGLRPLPTSVREARAGLRGAELDARPRPRRLRAEAAGRADRRRCGCATRLVEIHDGPAVLRGLDARAPARGDGGADGPQRCGQEHAAAADRRA